MTSLEKDNIKLESSLNPKQRKGRWWQQPILHFLLIGIALLAVHQWITLQKLDNRKSIVVDREALLTYIQYRAKYFDPTRSKDMLEGLNQQEIDKLIEDYLREEVLYREALALGLDRNDFIIRQRLIQKLNFINQNFSTGIAEVSDDEVRKYYEQHREKYVDPPYVTFTHVFFDNRNGGREQALSRAKRKLTELNSRKVSFHKGSREGDHFFFKTNYVESTLSQVTSHLGSIVAEAAFTLKSREDLWYGPFESEYGFHLIMITNRSEGKLLELETIYDQVKEDAKRIKIEDTKNKIIESVINAYDVQIKYQAIPADTQASSQPVLHKNNQVPGSSTATSALTSDGGTQ